jgi:hypothetical protein
MNRKDNGQPLTTLQMLNSAVVQHALVIPDNLIGTFYNLVETLSAPTGMRNCGYTVPIANDVWEEFEKIGAD